MGFDWRCARIVFTDVCGRLKTCRFPAHPPLVAVGHMLVQTVVIFAVQLGTFRSASVESLPYERWLLEGWARSTP